MSLQQAEQVVRVSMMMVMMICIVDKLLTLFCFIHKKYALLNELIRKHI
jgi:hypothetical protein